MVLGQIENYLGFGCCSFTIRCIALEHTHTHRFLYRILYTHTCPYAIYTYTKNACYFNAARLFNPLTSAMNAHDTLSATCVHKVTNTHTLIYTGEWWANARACRHFLCFRLRPATKRVKHRPKPHEPRGLEWGSSNTAEHNRESRWHDTRNDEAIMTRDCCVCLFVFTFTLCAMYTYISVKC